MNQKIQELKAFFLFTRNGSQIYSFLKTYVVVFLGILLAGCADGTSCLTGVFLIQTAKISLISVLRNIYKLLTE